MVGDMEMTNYQFQIIMSFLGLILAKLNDGVIRGLWISYFVLSMAAAIYFKVNGL